MRHRAALALNHDGKTDFVIRNSEHSFDSGASHPLFAAGAGIYGVAGDVNKYGKYRFNASALKWGARMLWNGKNVDRSWPLNKESQKARKRRQERGKNWRQGLNEGTLSKSGWIRALFPQRFGEPQTVTRGDLA
jgi:hypothetical protein